MLALTLTIFMLSLIGIPATAGFLAKYYVFTSAFSVTAHPGAMRALAVIGLFNSAVASYYYLRLIVVMYMREPVIAEAPAPASAPMKLALVLAAIATIYLGVIPGRVSDGADKAAWNLKSPGNPITVIRVMRTPDGSIAVPPLKQAATPAK